MSLTNASNEITRFKSHSLVSWLDLMREHDFVTSREDSKSKIEVLILKIPFFFRLSQNVIKKLMAKYDAELEIGGVFLAEPIMANEQRILRVRKAKFLRNISENPQCQYLAGKNRIQAMHESLMGTKSGLHFFPIPFHSHPQPKDEDNDYFIINKFIALETSKADKKSASYALSYPSLGVSLLFPRGLVYMVDSELFIGFYGGGIAPSDFKEYMKRITGKTMRELNSMMLEFAKEEKEWWKKALAAVGIFVTSLSFGMAPAYPPALYATTIQILKTRPRTRLQTYFALTKGEKVDISIP